jgi:predicted O-linked N-acetylglucosamine transferase (SPINDLY family)
LFERGRAHQKQGHAIDAMLCFQRALNAAPKAVEPRFHLGEVLWQLGRAQDAIGMWRETVAIAPDNPHAALALAEALLATGNQAGARDAAARALALAPPSAYASILHAIAAWTLADPATVDTHVEAIANAIAREPRLLTIPTVAGPLALALDGAPSTAARAALLAQIAGLAQHLAKAPALMLALVVEQAVTKAPGDATALLFELAAARNYAAGDHEALRRIALAATTGGSRSASTLRECYAALCAGVFAASIPLLWPQRTAGARLRVIALLCGREDPVATAAMAALAAMPRTAIDLTLAVLGSADLPAWLASSEAAALPRLGVGSAADGAARRIAVLDPDVLVDLVGLAAAAGPLLAQHPARAIVTLDALAAPSPLPLADRSVPSASELVIVLQHMHERLSPTPSNFPDPADMAAVWDEAVRAHQRGDHAVARERYSRVLDLQPGFAPALHLRGVLNRESGEASAARADFSAALVEAPGYVDARIAAARAALDDHEPRAAAALCAEAIRDKAPQPGLLRTWGLAELAMRNGAAAGALFEHVLALDPTDGESHYNHGVALQMQRKHAEAARAYQRAVALQPDLVAADFNLGVLFQEQGVTDAAIAAYRTVLAHDPQHGAAYKNLGETLLAAGRIDAAFANFDRFEANCPDALALAAQALEVLQHRGDFAKLDRYLDGLRRERFRAGDESELCDALEQLLYLLLFFDIEPSVVSRFAQTYDVTSRRIHGAPIARVEARRPGRIRVGYLSADLREHVMGKMVWQQVQHHDRARFALYFYSLARDRDAWTERFAGIAEGFAELADLGERDAAQRILDDDLDLLIDLSTHTKGARPGILALKPARVQITHVASAGTVGLATVDFKLTDRFADVPESQEHQLETLLPMDGCVYPLRRVAAATSPLRRDAFDIPADAVLIGVFVTLLKLSRRCLGLWSEVLARIPRARLVFSPANPAHRDSYVRLAAAAGIARDRLLFLPQGRDEAENRARYSLIDFVLDPMPYGGVNGTLEALDMGVPVVTLVGKRHAERTSFSILTNLGVTQTIAQSGREYVDIAVRLADDPAFRSGVRAAIDAGLAGSVLADAAGHARNLEAAYRRALAQRAPEALADAERASGAEDAAIAG